MGRVPITILGFHCERCSHEWLGKTQKKIPRVCPKCKSPYWDEPKRKVMMTYERFRNQIRDALKEAETPQTWTEIRTTLSLPQLFPNNQWVRKMEKDIGLQRIRDSQGIIHWQLK